MSLKEKLSLNPAPPVPIPSTPQRLSISFTTRPSSPPSTASFPVPQPQASPPSSSVLYSRSRSPNTLTFSSHPVPRSPCPYRQALAAHYNRVQCCCSSQMEKHISYDYLHRILHTHHVGTETQLYEAMRLLPCPHYMCTVGCTKPPHHRA